MTNSERRYLKKRGMALSVGSLLASLGASLGLIPGEALAQTTGTGTISTASAPTSTTGQTAQTTPAQQAEYQMEAAARGDGSQQVSAYGKNSKPLTSGGSTAGSCTRKTRATLG